MKLANALLSIVLFFTGCVTYPYTGKHVQIEGTETVEEKVALARNVFAALPPEQIHTQVLRHFAQLSPKDLKRIQLSHSVMHFAPRPGVEERSRREVHLIVTIYHNRKLHPIAHDIQEFVASLFREELERQRRA